MSKNEPGIEAVIRQARTDGAALGKLFELYQPLLLLSAQNQIDTRLAVRSDASDVVQQTFAEAVQAFHAFHGSTEPEFSAWIQRIHDRNLSDIVRKHVHAEKKSVEREQSLRPVDGSASIVWVEPAVDSSTPSRRLIKAEKALRLAQLLQSLPELQREAVRLRHLEGWPIQKIAEHLDRSFVAAAGLIKRGVRALREKMSEESWE